MNSEEFLTISNELEKFHAVFYQMWKMGEPVYSNETPTAFIKFDKRGDFIYFGINENFWKGLTFYEKLFIICHESMHIILNHGYRLSYIVEKRLGNQAADVVINHLLIKKFGFDRKKIKNWEEYCWIETLFDKKDNVKKDKNFEYYFNLLNKKSSTKNNKLVDDHSRLSLPKKSNEDSNNIIGELNNEMSEEEKNSIKETIEKHYMQQTMNMRDVMEKYGNFGRMAGKEKGNRWSFAKVSKIQEKRKWEIVIKKWANKYIKNDITSIEQWARINRRFAFLNKDLILPSEMEDENLTFDEKKIEVWFFQDTSGSCESFKDRFFKAALSLPKDRFDVKMHCFDTQVYKTDLKSKKLYGFGGTSFSIIENFIQKDIKKRGVEYPKAVFVITDGYGDNVSPQFPNKWYWFLSNNYKFFIPQKSNVYMLKDFE